MKKYALVICVALLLCGCGEQKTDTTSAIPNYTPVPTWSPAPSNEAEATSEPEATAAAKTGQNKVSDLVTKTVKKYEEETIDMEGLEGVDNFTLAKDNTLRCHDSNASGSNTFSLYEKKGNGAWKKSANQIIANFVNKYRVQVTKMKDYLVTAFDETILMADDNVIYKIDEEGNTIADAKMEKMFGKGTFEIHDWYWYKGNKVIANLSYYDKAGTLKEKVCCLIDIDRQKIVKRYSQSWEMRLVADGKIYGDQVDQNLITTILVVNPEDGKVEQKIPASVIRKTAQDRTEWNKAGDDYYRNQAFAYALCDGELYVKYMTGVFRYDADSQKWQQLLKESKKYKMGQCDPVTFAVADENHFYMMGEAGFYRYSAND